MADRVFYTIYRFFEEVHGPGDAAEVAAVFTWSVLLGLNVITVFVLLIAAIGTPPVLRGRIAYLFGVVGLIVAGSQYFHYLAGDRLRKLRNELSVEPHGHRRQRRWMSFTYAAATLTAFCGSLWFLSAMR